MYTAATWDRLIDLPLITFLVIYVLIGRSFLWITRLERNDIGKEENYTYLFDIILYTAATWCRVDRAFCNHFLSDICANWKELPLDHSA